MTDIRQTLDLAYKQLKAYSATAVLDAEVLLAHVLNKDRTFLYAHPEMILNKEDFLAFQQLVTRRSLGVPIAYLTGTREFWSLPITVNTETLIPRPETELIVELALKLVEETQPARILDLGTGSGAIALALGKERPRWEVSACDCSPGALKTAQENAARLNLTNINFFHSDWFTNIEFTKPFCHCI